MFSGMWRHRIIVATVVLLAVSLAVAGCRRAEPDQSKPFGLGGDSVVVGFTPTPTASHPPTASPSEDGETQEPTTPPSNGGPDTAAGQQFFAGGSCVACHAIEGISSGSIGPELTHLGSDAAGRVPGQSAEDYIRESILDPSAFVVDGFTAGIMPPGLVSEGSDLDNLVAFLLSRQ